MNRYARYVFICRSDEGMIRIVRVYRGSDDEIKAKIMETLHALEKALNAQCTYFKADRTRLWVG